MINQFLATRVTAARFIDNEVASGTWKLSWRRLNRVSHLKGMKIVDELTRPLSAKGTPFSV